MMKREIAMWIGCATFGMAGTGYAEAPGTLHFLNGDSLPGDLDSLTRERVGWASPALAGAASFFTEGIRELRLPTVIHTPDSGSGHEATVTLTNGNTVRGQLASVADDRIALDTWFAGRLTFRRAMVRDLEIREMPEYLYRGPRESASWTQSTEPGAWAAHESGGLIATRAGGIAKEIPLPEAFTLEFDAQWQSSLRMHLVLFSDDVSTDTPGGGYEIVFQRQSVHIRRCGEREWIGHSNRAIELQQNERARIRVRASSRTGQFAFYVNDRIIDAWTDPEIGDGPAGGGLHFVSRDNSPLIISRIDISRWNGVLEETLDERQHLVAPGVAMRMNWWDPEAESADEPEAEEEGTMALRNGDRIRGTVKSIEDGTIRIETPFREIALPVERLRTLALAPVALEEPKLENGDVRAWFAEGGSMVFRLEGITEDGSALRGYSQTFGNAVFLRSAFNRIEFNIYDFFKDEGTSAGGS